MLVGSLYEDLGGGRSKVLNPPLFHLDLKPSVAHANYFHANFPPTLIRLSSVLFRFREELPIFFSMSFGTCFAMNLYSIITKLKLECTTFIIASL